MIATQEDAVSTDVLATRVTDRIAVITLGSPKRIYFDAEMGDALTAALDGYAGDPNIRAVVLTGGAPGYFARHFSITSVLQLARRLTSRPPESVAAIKRLVRNATETPLAQGLALERNLFLKLCISDAGLARMRSYEAANITSPTRSIEVNETEVNRD
jgi:enoyl-CoA hydratase/carnithine racemase